MMITRRVWVVYLWVAGAVVATLAGVACAGAGSPPAEPPPQSDGPAYVQHLVYEAIAMYDSLGPEQTFAHYSSPARVDGAWYVFIASAETERHVAHPNPATVGSDLNTARDPNGYCFGCQFLKTNEGGDVVVYRHTNPATGIPTTKQSFVILHDGYIFGSGWYDQR